VGYSFAVPETIVRKIVIDLKESGVVQRAVLGISFRAIDQQFIDQMGETAGISEIGGIYVASVAENGAASEAGIRKGDYIISAGGEDVEDSGDVLRVRRRYYVGDEMPMTIWRDGETIDVVLKLEQAVE
jgi:S1-C subfamily serine protease